MTIEVTPELIDAVKGIKHWLEFAKQNQPDKADFLKAVGYPGKAPVKQEWLETILAALPEEVTNPKPELPTTPGFYEDQYGDPWKLSRNGYWYDKSYTVGHHAEIERVRECAPFTRLLPEKPPVTVEEAQHALLNSRMNLRYEQWQAVADYVNGDRA